MVCVDLCQHRTCVYCEEFIHRGGKDDDMYYDDAGNDYCFLDDETLEGKFHTP